jgi:hypothetical protein
MVERPHDPHAPHAGQHPELHEHIDIPIRPIAYTLVGIFALLLFSFGAMYLLFWRYANQEAAAVRGERDTAIESSAPAGPPADVPRLQGVPGYSSNTEQEDMAAMRESNRLVLENYGRAKDGYARIPINRAIDVAVERGLLKSSAPATTAPANAATQPVAGAPQAPAKNLTEGGTH